MPFEPDPIRPRRREIRIWDYRDAPLPLERGAELGRFNIGSTAIVLFGRGKAQWDTTVQADSTVRRGQRMGKLLS